MIPFASKLLEAGIDAWVDQWEMHPGDSLVQRIFEEGISNADAFIVVLSHISVTKPWVREELDAGVVQRINSGGSKRLIPVVLDRDVAVPVALQHLLWESVPEHQLDGVVQHVVDALLGRSRKPPIGAPPAYVSVATRWTNHPADETVFQLVVKLVRDHGPGWTLFSNDIESEAGELGITSDRFHESMHALVDGGLVNAQVMAGGQRWMIKPFSDDVWLRLELEAGIDLESVRRELLANIVNSDLHCIRPSEIGVSGFTIGALLRDMQREGLFTVHELLDKTFSVSHVSPLARRALREQH